MNNATIGTFGNYTVVMSFEDLKKIANHKVVERLQEAEEVIEFYASMSEGNLTAKRYMERYVDVK